MTTEKTKNPPVNKERLLKAICGFVGYTLVAVGIACIYPPGGMIAAGCLLIFEAMKR